MKHEPYFQTFLQKEVNLNQDRLDQLNDHVEAVTGFLSKRLPSYESIERQGSLALGTIIKPVGNREYDADLQLRMESASGWEPRGYLNEVYKCFGASDRYGEMVRQRTRCVTLDYAGDVHLDIVPCVDSSSGLWICNRDTNDFERTDGTGYRDWFNKRNAMTKGNLKRSVRLLKYLRDHKVRFTVKSIVLTTLAGGAVTEGDDFSGIPATLRTVMNEMNRFLQANEEMPKITNPALPGETFTRHWNEEQYRNFRSKVNLYASWVNDAIEESNHNASVKKWRKVFGDRFGEMQESQKSTRVKPEKPWAR